MFILQTSYGPKLGSRRDRSNSYPPFTAIPALAKALEKNPIARLGAQNMHWEKCGAFTGEISAPMLRALYVNNVVHGHSEPRRLFGETDEMVNRKIITALSGLNISHSRRVGREFFFNTARHFDIGHVPQVGSLAKSRWN